MLSTGRADLIWNFLHVTAGHLKLGVPELCLNISRIAMLLEVCRAGSAKSLIGHVADAGFSGERFKVAFQIIAEAKCRTGFAREQQV